jgi:hypothetical protein
MTEAQERQALYPRPERRGFTAKTGNRIKATQLISPHSMFSSMGLRPTESDYLLKTEDRHKAPSRKMLSHPDFVPFRPQDSNVSVQIGKVGL